MRKYEITFDSVNLESYSKPITALVLEPDGLTQDTGVMLFTHGWGGNRFQHQDKMLFSVEKFNLICVAVEVRQSGYDFDPVKGSGAYRPYDAGFYQVFDVLNGLREILALRPGLNRRRLFHYGGSQGGHISLLSSIFAPDTFAFVYASSPLTHLDEDMQGWAGREFAEYELAVRDVGGLAGRIRCPVFLEHGTADSTVPCETHTRSLVRELERLGKKHEVVFYEGGEHSLEPTVTKLDAFCKMAVGPMGALENDREDDFLNGKKVEIDCGEKRLEIDWSIPGDDVDLFRWI